MAHGRCGLRLFAHGERLPDKGAWQLSGLILSNRGTFFFFFFLPRAIKMFIALFINHTELPTQQLACCSFIEFQVPLRLPPQGLPHPCSQRWAEAWARPVPPLCSSLLTSSDRTRPVSVLQAEGQRYPGRFRPVLRPGANGALGYPVPGRAQPAQPRGGLR